MKVYEIKDKFGLENLKLTERPEPTAGPLHVKIRVDAVSLNFRDLLTVRGFYNPKQKLPLIPVSDGVGRVVEVGPGVSRVKVGDRVAAIFAQKWISNPPTRARLLSTLGGPFDGMLAEYVVLHEDGLVHVPAHLSDTEAATLPCAGVTAWSALFVEGKVQPGQTVLVLGTGGVSIFALQFAVMAGARVIVTSSSDEKLERARNMGAVFGVNYRTAPDWWKPVREFTGDEGVDHVVEVGGAGTLDASVRSVKIGGAISMIGVLAGGSQEINLTRVLMQNIRIQGIIVGCRDSFEAMNSAIAARNMVPVVDRVFGFGEVHDAIEHMANGRHFGKVCIRVTESAT